MSNQPENQEIIGGASSSRSAGDAAGSGGQPDGSAPPPSRSRPDEISDLVTIHVAPAISVLLAALAAENGLSVTRMVTVMTVQAVEACGLASLARAVANEVIDNG